MRQGFWIGILGAFLWAAASASAGEVTVDGQKVTIDTKRFLAVFSGVTLQRLENRLTGEIYTTDAPQESPAAAILAEHAGIAIESLRPAVPVKYYAPVPQSKVSSEPVPGGARITFMGLQSGSATTAEFIPAMQLIVTYTVDALTGDLIVTPEALGNIEKAHGVQDRGVLRSALLAPKLSGDLRLVLPTDHGSAYSAIDVPAAWTQSPASFVWPKIWEAALLIAESKKGSFAIWAEEPALRYGRWLYVSRSPQGWQAAFEFESMVMNYRSDKITGASWRLNTFSSGWLHPARHYQEQMLKWWPDLTPLAKSKPVWADKLRLIVEPSLPDESLLKRLVALPKEATAVFSREGWAPSDVLGKNRAANRGDTLWPVDSAWLFTPPPQYKERIAAVESAGVRVFPFAGIHLTSGGWQAKPIADGDSVYTPDHILHPGAGFYRYTWRLWARLYPEACKVQHDQFGGSGISEDRSWIMRRALANEPDNENWFTGSMKMRNYLRQLLPDTALMGDQVNEVTCRGQQLSRAVTLDPAHAHPLGAFLFGPFTRQWSADPRPEINSADDRHGFLPGWHTADSTLPEATRELMRTRGELFAREELSSVWPEEWEKNVLHYYKSKDGSEYRLVRDDTGESLRKKEQVLYRRIYGTNAAEAKDMVIPQWVGYDGDRIIGLNPKVTYLPQPNAKKPEVIISKLPEGVVIRRTLHGKGFWMVDLEPANYTPPVASSVENGSEVKAKNVLDKPPVSASAQITLEVRGSIKGISFSGAQKVESGQPTRITLNVPGSLAAYWQAPFNGSELHLQPPAVNIIRAPQGLATGNALAQIKDAALTPPLGCPEYGDATSLAWLIEIPPDLNWLFFKFGLGKTNLNTGVQYTVRCNGKPLWTRLRLENGSLVKGEKSKIYPVRFGGVNLNNYAANVVVLELISTPQGTALNNEALWSRPQFYERPPTFSAEMDEPLSTAPPLNAPDRLLDME